MGVKSVKSNVIPRGAKVRKGPKTPAKPVPAPDCAEMSPEDLARLDAHLAESEDDELVPGVCWDKDGRRREFNAIDENGNFVLVP
jgi:hypothetical protein